MSPLIVAELAVGKFIPLFPRLAQRRCIVTVALANPTSRMSKRNAREFRTMRKHLPNRLSVY